MHTRPRWFAPSSLRALSGLALLLLAAPAARAGLFAADSTYEGYRIPEHRWSQWTLSANSSAYGSDGGRSDGVYENGSFGGNFATRAAFFYDSDRLQHQWNFSVDAGGSRSHTESRQEYLGQTAISEASYQNLDQHFSLNGSLRHYPAGGQWGVTLSTSHRADLYQRFEPSHREIRYPISRSVADDGYSEGERTYYGSLEYWVGLGHVRDATPVHRAQVLEERLRRNGVIRGPLSGRARNQLASLFTVQSDVGAAHQRSSRYFWREVERVLRAEGAIESLDAYSLLQLLEPITAGRTIARPAGFFVGPAVKVSTTRGRRTIEATSSRVYFAADTVYASYEDALTQKSNPRQDAISTGLQAEFHRPAGPRWQLDASTNVSIREQGKFPNVSSSLGIAYILSDRWLATARASQSALANRHARRTDQWDTRLDAELAYFLEDSWTMYLQLNERQLRYQGAFNRSLGLSAGLTWIVSGFFEAPGLVGAMRPTPPIP